MMKHDEAIAQLEDMRKDRESFLVETEPYSVYAEDIRAIDTAIKAMEENEKLKRLLRLAAEETDFMATFQYADEVEELIGGAEMADIKLKPCPFCGVIPHFKQKANCFNDTSKATEFTVFCQGCGIEFPAKFTFKIEFDLESTSGIKLIVDEREKAAEAWNRRC